MRAVNLLPRDNARSSTAKGPNAVVVGAVLSAVVLTALLSGLFLMAHGKATQKREELKSAQNELSSLPVPAQNEVNTQNALAADQTARVSALSTALSKRVAWDRVLREFSQVLPSDVWLLNLSAKSPVSSIAAAPAAPSSGTTALPPASGFTIEGYTYSHNGVARLLSRLMVVPDLTNVQLNVSERQKVDNQPVIHFRISADVRQPGAPAS
ncbi:MAG: PilN domain-containing protein [Actinomycetota bacterium]|nr:PilN domain-containing protein [Actinomycetota bacterium]